MLRLSVSLPILSAVGGLAGLLGQLVLAHAYGAGAALDTYLMVASVPLMLMGFGTTVLNFSLVPQLLGARDQPSKFHSVCHDLFKAILVLAIGIVAVGSFVAWPLTKFLLELGSRRVDEWTGWVCRLSWLHAALMLVVSYLVCVLNAQRSFRVGILVLALPPLGMTVSVLMLSGSLNLIAIPLGNAAGALTAAAVLYLRARAYVTPPAEVVDHSVDLRGYALGLPMVSIGMSCFISYAGTDALWAPLAGAGALSCLGYAQRLIIAAASLVNVGALTTISTVMADEHGRAGESAAHARLIKAIGGTVVAGLGVAVVASAMAHPIVRILFQRGSFDEAATQQVAEILPAMMLGMVAMVGMTILMKGLFQLRLDRAAMWLGLSWSLGYFCTAALVVSWAGVKGMAIAYAGMWWLVFGWGLAVLVRHMADPMLSRSLLTSMAIAMAAAAIVYCALRLLDVLLMPISDREVSFSLLLQCAICVFAGLGAYAAIYFRLRRSGISMRQTR